MSSIKLWYSPGACSLAPHILLKEIGVDFEAIGVEVRQGAPEELRKVNPKMRVPVLVLDNEVITETPAIMTAISQLAPEKHLFGKTNMEVIHSYEWLNWLSGTVHVQAFGGLFRPARFSDDAGMYAAIQQKGWKTVQECFDAVEAGLHSAHAVGADLTVADPYLYVFYRWGVSGGIDMPARYPKYAALVAKLVKRSAVQAALKDEGIESHAPEVSGVPVVRQHARPLTAD
ncbi:hypothetical protein PMZ80_007147 [Knufia obscura]|uniref:Glutathione S-transferase n=2 Tax=Knufia TaxID=430999 RepID=A0AAN8EDM4_9EURO|nr:hypothetical protein PMZ80_007147 [Knufia obscura]KAK5953154.1 hypothetical protein OHC33_005722 [Knufia fluminis]